MTKTNKFKIIITGCAGFIGFHLALKLLENKSYKIFGIDNINNYYDTKLKHDRLNILRKNKNFFFNKIDICHESKVKNFFNKYKFDYVIHLAAQAGVRNSILNPRSYLNSNILGFFNVIDSSKNIKVRHFIYASTSSVYGDSKKFPLKEEFDTSSPQSFYAATKKSNEVIAYSYSNIHKIKTTGLRFFTVYGPYGRPDMALFKFTKLISENKKIDLFNRGVHKRDFTYIDDVVDAVEKIIKKPSKKLVPFQIFNIGSDKPQKLTIFLEKIEKYLGMSAKVSLKKLQAGDVVMTHADISKLKKETNYKPSFNITDGIKNFILWYKEYYSKK